MWDKIKTTLFMCFFIVAAVGMLYMAFLKLRADNNSQVLCENTCDPYRVVLCFKDGKELKAVCKTNDLNNDRVVVVR